MCEKYLTHAGTHPDGVVSPNNYWSTTPMKHESNSVHTCLSPEQSLRIDSNLENLSDAELIALFLPEPPGKSRLEAAVGIHQVIGDLTEIYFTPVPGSKETTAQGVPLLQAVRLYSALQTASRWANIDNAWSTFTDPTR